MCLSKGVFVLVCLALGALGAFFVAASASSRTNKSVLLVCGSIAISASISGITILQHDIACGGFVYPYA